MVQLCKNARLLASIMMCTILGWAMSAKAEIRSKSSGAKTGKSAPMKNEPAKKGPSPGTAGNAADGSGDSNERDSLADDDSQPSASDGKNSKSSVKKKSSQKGAPGSKPSAGGRSGRPRNVDPPLNQQGIVAPDLDLEPEP